MKRFMTSQTSTNLYCNIFLRQIACHALKFVAKRLSWMTRCIIMGSPVSPVSILGPLPQISEHTPIKTLALVTIFVVKLMCWWWFHMESIKVGLDLKDLSCSFSRSPLQGLCRSRAHTGIIFMKNLPNSKRHTSQTVAASKAEGKLRLDYYGIGQS